MTEVQGIRSALSADFDLYQLGHLTHEFPHVNIGGLADGIKKGEAAGKANPPDWRG